MARRKKYYFNKGRMFSLMLYCSLLFILGFFAKDNLIDALKQKLLGELPHRPLVATTTGSIEVVFSPNQGAAKAIADAIAQAKSSILVSAYSFTSNVLAKALLDAKKRGVVVKVILDKSQMSQSYSSAHFFINQGFDLRIDIKHAIYHNKVIIIDNKNIITGSYNFTKAAENKNAENVLIIRDNHHVANLYTHNWRSHWQNAIKPEEFLKRISLHRSVR